ncbi:MAG: rhomboid family intramembrane serine protease [Polyangiaceae bacterium]
MTMAYSTSFELPPKFSFLGPVSTQQKVQEWLLVLRSVGLDGSVRWVPTAGVGHLVTDHQYLRAAQTLRDYELENRDWPPVQRKDQPLYAESPWAIIVVSLLVAMFAITGPAAARSTWFQLGTANTDMILHGAPWQAVTALHSDASHVIGNALSGGIFLTGVHRRLGSGLGTFVALAAGAAGNYANAVWHGSHHLSIGASTAVFEALGALATAQMIRNQANRSPREKGLRAMASAPGSPLPRVSCCSVCSAQVARATRCLSSLTHLAPTWALTGSVSSQGCSSVSSLPTSLRKRTTPLPAWVQSAFGVASIAIVTGSWLLAVA